MIIIHLKVRPEHRGKQEFRVGALIKEKTAQTLFAARSDQQIDVRQSSGIKLTFKSGLIPLAPWHDFISEGFLGALTTFSTFSAETFHQYARGECLKGTLNILLNMIFCILGAAAGLFMLV